MIIAPGAKKDLATPLTLAYRESELEKAILVTVTKQTFVSRKSDFTGYAKVGIKTMTISHKSLRIRVLQPTCFASTAAPGLNCGGTTYHHTPAGSWSSHQGPATSVSNFHHSHHPHHSHHSNNYPNYYTSTTSNPSGGSNPGPPAPQATAPYLTNPAAPPTMVFYPHLYSTVNQNQIHLHLHSSSSPSDVHGNSKTGSSLGDTLQCYHHPEDDTATIVAAATGMGGGVGSNNVTISTGARGGIEIGILHHQQQAQAPGGSAGTQEDDQGLSRYSGSGAGGTDRQQTDPSVWRPY